MVIHLFSELILIFNRKRLSVEMFYEKVDQDIMSQGRPSCVHLLAISFCIDQLYPLNKRWVWYQQMMMITVVSARLLCRHRRAPNIRPVNLVHCLLLLCLSDMIDSRWVLCTVFLIHRNIPLNNCRKRKKNSIRIASNRQMHCALTHSAQIYLHHLKSLVIIENLMLRQRRWLPGVRPKSLCDHQRPALYPKTHHVWIEAVLL